MNYSPVKTVYTYNNTNYYKHLIDYLNSNCKLLIISTLRRII